MKKFFLALSIILSGLIIYLIVVNNGSSITLNLPFNAGTITHKTSITLLGFAVLVCLADFFAVLWFIMSKTDLNKTYQIKMDKLSVQADNDKSQVKILENKIKTLEAVVEKLTKEKNV